MAEIYVQSSSAIRDVITQLRDLNTQFHGKADDVRAEHTRLITNWEGDASTAFEEHFHNEESNFDVFEQAVLDYIVGLERILAEYEQAEEQNKQIAST